MNYKLSIILPCYNIGKYIDKCITSILLQESINKKTTQSIINQSFEIIIIDDRSTDNLPQLCRKWTQNENITFIHYENSGVSTARNRSIYHAKGEYIWFIDPDDYITPNALSIIFKQLEDNPDLLLFNFNILFEKNNSTTTIKNFLTNSSEVKIINDKQLIRDYIPYIIGYSQDNINRMYKGMKIQTKDGFMHGAVWHYIFKREIINKENIWFSPHLKLNEDTMFTLQYLCYVNRMKALPYSLYNYMFRSSGSMHGILANAKNLFQSKIHLAEERERINSLYKTKHQVDLRRYYAGSLLLSALELGIKLSKQWRNIKLFKQYSNNQIVRKAINSITTQHAPLKFKIPIILLKKKQYNILYAIFFLLNKIGYQTKIH